MSKVWKCDECVKHGTDGCYNGSRFEDENCKYMIIDIDYAYEQGRVDELDKIFKMMLLGCAELQCDECNYRIHSQDVCQQAYTAEIIENYIAEQLKGQSN